MRGVCRRFVRGDAFRWDATKGIGAGALLIKQNVTYLLAKCTLAKFGFFSRRERAGVTTAWMQEVEVAPAHPALATFAPPCATQRRSRCRGYDRSGISGKCVPSSALPGTFSRREKEEQPPGDATPRIHVCCATACHRKVGRGLLQVVQGLLRQRVSFDLLPLHERRFD